MNEPIAHAKSGPTPPPAFNINEVHKRLGFRKVPNCENCKHALKQNLHFNAHVCMKFSPLVELTVDATTICNHHERVDP